MLFSRLFGSSEPIVTDGDGDVSMISSTEVEIDQSLDENVQKNSARTSNEVEESVGETVELEDEIEVKEVWSLCISFQY